MNQCRYCWRETEWEVMRRGLAMAVCVNHVKRANDELNQIGEPDVERMPVQPIQPGTGDL